MDLCEKSLRILELPVILEQLAAEAVCETAKEAALAIRPSNDYHTVKSRLEETTAARHMMVLRSSPPFSGVKDIRATVKRADMGGTLNTRELLDIAGLLRSADASITYFRNQGMSTAAPRYSDYGIRNSELKDKASEDNGTAIDYLFTALRSNKFLENKISSAIIAEDEISDNASSDLADIRRHMRITSEKVRQALNRIITSPAYSKALQEPIITMKNNRYVVPVKAEYKSSVPGLVHDISSSGATQFIEPLTVVQINNELRELAAKEKQEIERILSELSADTADSGEDIISDYEILAALDLIFAKAKLSNKQDAIEPELSEEMRVRLKNARHPLLPPKEAVPIDIRLGGEFDTLVITGPNTGGKTVSLKTLGLLCTMAQCGLHIPATEESIVPIFGCILADIGDEQSIEQSLSTFSSHMTNIVGILDFCEADSLLLFDEMGAGTDPVEGAALAMAIIEYAREKGSLIAATTHYAELKIYAVTSPGVANASCEFDVETLRPTFRLITGIPGKSNAFAISRRLGLPEGIIEDAKSRVNTENAAFEDALESLENTRITLEGERFEAGKLLRDAEADRRRAEELKSRIDHEHKKAAESAKREAARILEEARNTAESVMEELREIRRKAANETDWHRLNEDKADLFRRLNEADDALERSDDLMSRSAGADKGAPEPPSREPAPGDRVKLRKLGTFADVISVSADGVLSLQAGIMKITARADEVRLVEGGELPEIKRQSAKSDAKLREIAAKPEVDLRGMATDEAVPVLERFIDNARIAKLNTVTIIHGKGTGAMRQAVHQCLRKQHGIKAFRLGRYGEGEDGVTIVEI